MMKPIRQSTLVLPKESEIQIFIPALWRVDLGLSLVDNTFHPRV